MRRQAITTRFRGWRTYLAAGAAALGALSGVLMQVDLSPIVGMFVPEQFVGVTIAGISLACAFAAYLGGSGTGQPSGVDYAG